MAEDAEKHYIEGDATTKGAIEKAAATTQLADRYAGTTIGGGIAPPYSPSKLATFQELNGTHQVAIGKKSMQEVGNGFDIVPHERVDDPNESERDELESFWYGRDTIWKIGPQGTTAASPTEVFELARQDWHGIGWLCIELLYGDDNELQGLAHVPADEVRVRKADDASEQVAAGHGYVQEDNANTVYYGEPGGRKPHDGEQPTYVDQEDGDVYHDLANVGDAANELLFIPNPSPLSKYYGIPDWVAAIQTMVGDQEAKRFNREFFEWDAMGQYFVTVGGGTLSDDSREGAKEMVTGLREKDGRRVAVLESGDRPNDDIEIDIEQIQQHSDAEMGFSEFRRMNEHEVAKVHNIPKILINRTETSNRSNSREQVRSFINSVIKPRQERFAGRIYRIIHQRVLGVADWALDFRTRGGVDEQRQAEIAATKIKQAGPALTVNEVREMVGEEPLDSAAGEQLFSQLGGSGGGGGAIQDEIETQIDDLGSTLRDELSTEELLAVGQDTRPGAGAD